MSNIRRTTAALALLALFACAAGVSHGQNAKPQPTPIEANVNVINTPTVNVGNTPSVNVANTPNVNVTNTPSVNVANTPNVNLLNTPDVHVTNTANVNIANTPEVTLAPTAKVGISPAANTVQIAPGGEAFYHTFIVNIDGGSYYASSPYYVVPAGKRLVVEYISANATLPDQQLFGGVTVSVATVDNFGLFDHYLQPGLPYSLPFIPAVNYTFGQPMRLYLDAGMKVRMNASRNANVSQAQATITLTGYLVNLP